MTLLAASLLMLVSTTAGPDTRHAVLFHTDGRFEAISGSALDAPPAASVHHAWVWSSESAPRHVLPRELSHALSPDKESLSVRVVRRADCKPVPVELVAAPVAMWHDVPEPLLLRFPVPKNGVVAVPRAAGQPWRVRVIGPGLSSAWTDVEVGRTRTDVVVAPASDLPVAATALGSSLPHLAFLRVFLDPRSKPGKPTTVALFEPLGPRQFLVPSFPSGGDFVLLFTAPEVAPLVAKVTASRAALSINMTHGAELRGILNDHKGQILAGGIVEAICIVSPELPIAFPRITASKNDGSWRLLGLPTGKAALLFQFKGLVPERRELKLSEGDLDLGVVRLQPAIELPVRVIDDVGVPVANAEVRASPASGGSTDAKGVLILRGLASEGSLKLAVKADRHLPKELTLAPPFGDEMVVQLARAFVVSGRLVTGEGVPVTDAEVRLEIANATQAMAAVGGAFSFALPSATAAELVVRSPSHAELRLEVKPGQAGQTRDLGDVRLQEGSSVIGSVVSAEDSSPIPGARVWAPRPSKDGPLVSWMLQDLLQATTRDDGAFVLRGARPGPLVLRVEAAGYARSQAEVTLKPEAPADAGEIRLLHGAVVRVRLEPPQEGDGVARLDLRGEGRDFDMLTAELRDSSAVIEHVPPGTFPVTVLSGGKVLCEVKAEVPEKGTDVNVTCSSKPVNVHGRVMFGHSPSGAGILSWTVVSGSQVPEGIMTRTLPGGLQQQQAYTSRPPDVSVQVNSDGSFATQDLSPGNWQVSFIAPGSPAPTPPQSVAIPQAEEAEVNLVYAGRSVTGLVVDEAGSPVARAQVRESESGGFAVTTTDGHFAIPGLDTGAHHLQARTTDECSDVAVVQILADREPDPVRLVISKENSADLTIRVVTADGSAAPGGFVFLEIPGRGALIATTDAEGRAVVRVDKPFPDTVRAAAFAVNSCVLGGWCQWLAARQGLVLNGGATGSLALQSEKSAGTVRVVSSDGWDITWLLSRLGASPTVKPGGTLLFANLPVGSYSVTTAQWSGSANIEAGREMTLRLP